MMRLAVAALLAAVSTASLAQTPPSIVTQPSKLDAQWQARTRAFYEKSIEIPTVSGRGQMPAQAKLIADELKAAGFAEADIKIVPYEGEPGDKTVALAARWRGLGAPAPPAPGPRLHSPSPTTASGRSRSRGRAG